MIKIFDVSINHSSNTTAAMGINNAKKKRVGGVLLLIPKKLDPKPKPHLALNIHNLKAYLLNANAVIDETLNN